MESNTEISNEEKLKKEEEELNKNLSNDEQLKKYLEFKKNYNLLINKISVIFPKIKTKIFSKILKSYRIEYKNIHNIKHNDTNDENTFITKFDYNEENLKIVNDLLSNNLTPEEKKIPFKLSEEKINIKEENYTYDEFLKLYFKEINESFDSIPGGFEIIGKIAHLNLRDNFIKYKYVIGQLIIDKNPGIKTVVNKVGKIENVYRTYNMEILAGKVDYNVEHKEGNCLFKFDLRYSYWSSRLQGERDRILKLIKNNEILCDAFCGVGPLSLRACKKGIKVFANDLNPSCFKYLNNNIIINKINKNLIHTYNMDARDFIKTLIEKTKHLINDDEDNLDNNFPHDVHIDHIYMNLPKDAIEFLDVFIGLFKGCKENIYNKDNLPIVHVYGFAKTNSDSDPIEELKMRIAKAFKIDYNLFKEKCEKDILNIENVRDISNKKVVFCIDMKIPYIIGFKLYDLK